MFMMWDWAGPERFPGLGEFVKLKDDGTPIVCYRHNEFEELMLDWKTFQKPK